MRYISAISMLMLCLLPLCGDTMGTQDANGCIPITLPPPHLPLMEQSREGETEGGRETGGEADGEEESARERERERHRERQRERDRERGKISTQNRNAALRNTLQQTTSTTEL